MITIKKSRLKEIIIEEIDSLLDENHPDEVLKKVSVYLAGELEDAKFSKDKQRIKKVSMMMKKIQSLM